MDSVSGLKLTPRKMIQVARARRAGPTARSGGLFVSTTTASVHVSNILAKLGVSGRVAAAAVAHRLGVYGPPALGRMP